MTNARPLPCLLVAFVACGGAAPQPTTPETTETPDPTEAPPPSEDALPEDAPSAAAEERAEESTSPNEGEGAAVDAPAPVDEGRCHAAFDHMTEVSTREIETLPPEERKMALELAEKQKASDDDRRRNFVAKCMEGGIDLDCILGASDTMSYIACFQPRR